MIYLCCNERTETNVIAGVFLLLFFLISFFFTTTNLFLLSLSHSKNAWLSVTAGRYNNDTLLCGHMDHFDLVISNDEADIGFYAREHNEGDAFVAWYKALEYDIAGIELCVISVMKFISNAMFTLNTSQLNNATNMNGNKDSRNQGPIVERADDAIQPINGYPTDKGQKSTLRILPDRDLASGQRYPTFEQLGPEIYKQP